jgi:UDP:flavonoid glycosyltransferase YjiC (YdhE family)
MNHIPTRTERRALFADALQRAGYTVILPSHALAIRAAVEVVLGDELANRARPTTARHRAEFLALADAIEGDA